MRTVARAELMALPDGVLYRERWPGGRFGGLQMKVGACGENDWFSLDLEVPVDCHDSTERMDILEGMEPFCLDFEASGRDGAFEAGALYLVYERDDLDGLRGVLARAVAA